MEIIKKIQEKCLRARILAVSLAICALAVSANAAPIANLSPTSLTFGNQMVGTSSAAQYITLNNAGNATLTFSASFTGDYAFAGSGTCGSSVAPGASCTISVKFTPTAAGSRTGTLTLTDNASGSPQKVALAGTGTTTSSLAPSITTQPANQAVTAGQSATFMVAATGTAPLSYQWRKNGTTISGATSSSYATPATTSSDNGAQFTVVVSNSAGSATSNAATLTVNPAAGLNVSPTSLTFGSQAVGTSSAAQYITLNNAGNATLTFSASFTGDYAFAGSGTCGSSVAPGASCTISVKFTPTAAGTRTGTLTLTDNASGSPQKVALAGTGTTTSSLAPSITTQPANQAVTAGQSATFMVAATGTAPLSYQWRKNGTTISGATSSSYATPATTSSDNGAQFTVVVSNSAGSATSNAATLTVNPAAGLNVSPTSLTFGSQAVGTSSAAQYITLNNAGNATLTFSASFTGDYAFAGSGTCGSSVAPGASCTISVKFTPTA